MKIRRLLFLFSLPPLSTAYTSYKNVSYLRNPEAVNDLKGTSPLYDTKIMPKDLLNITVNTTSPQAAAPFNLAMQTPLNTALMNINTTTQPTLQQYPVNNSGGVDFPAVSILGAGDLAKDETKSLIRKRLRPYSKEAPIMTVCMANYKISVLSEVIRSGSFMIGNEKVNILEASAMTDDMTVYGIHDNMKLIREDEGGKRKIVSLDLNNAGVVASLYYYLKQNDILYITPNKTKVKNSGIGSSTTLWVSSISILISIAGLLANVLK